MLRAVVLPPYVHTSTGLRARVGLTTVVAVNRFPRVTPRFFRSAAELRRWFETHHARRTELWIGFYRKGSGKTSVTYAEALDQALCFGWIDGVRKKLDDVRYTNRFTPRRPRSIWSNVNVAHVQRLQRDGLMHPSGLATFDARTPDRTGVYSFELRVENLPDDLRTRLARDRTASRYFEAQPPWYRRTVVHWVTSAKRPETRERRFTTLIACCHNLEWIAPLRDAGKRPKRPRSRST